MGNFDEDIKRISDELMQNGTVEEIIKERIKKGYEDAVDSAFKWGDLKHAIEKRVTEVLVPYIGKYDMSQYIVKLDTVLTDIVNETILADNKKILENFRNLMIEPNQEAITLSEVFEKYKEFVADNVDTSGREVDTDDEPTYVGMDVFVSFEKEKDRSWSSFERAIVELGVEEEDQEEKLNFTIPLSRYKGYKDEGWRIDFASELAVSGLRYLDDFKIFLHRLTRAGVKLIVDIEQDDDCVIPDERPEAVFE